MTPAVSARGISKRYRMQHDRASSLKEALVRRNRSRGSDEFWALRDIDLDIQRGAFYGLIGHNGSGKSTLLKLLAGIHRPTAGDLVVDGRVSALLELGSGFHPELTGRENVYLNGAILGLSRKQMDSAVDEIIEFSGIGDFVDAPVKVLSSGMYVRLGFAVAVHVDPEILLIDEVIAVGDEEFQRRCLDHLSGLRRRGATIVLVSHALPLVEGLCDEVAWLDHGQMMQSGPSNDVCWAYTESVNSAEVNRLSDETEEVEADSHEPADTDRRRGSGEMRIVGIEYLDVEYNSRRVAASGDPFTIRLWYEASQRCVEPVFGLRFHSSNGVHVASSDSAAQDMASGTVEIGRGYVDFMFDRMILLPGEYLLSTEVLEEDKMRVVDVWERANVLRIQPGSSLESEGLVEIGGRWQPPAAHPADGP